MALTTLPADVKRGARVRSSARRRATPMHATAHLVVRGGEPTPPCLVAAYSIIASPPLQRLIKYP